jgi:DNA repair protein RadC
MNTINQISDAVLRREYSKRFYLKTGDTILSSVNGADHLRTLIKNTSREHFIVVFLSSQNKVIKTETLFKGSISNAFVCPREVVKKVIEHSASAVILGHNHPSGNLTFSRDDQMITEKIARALKTIDVSVHDHILVTGENYKSMADTGIMPN